MKNNLNEGEVLITDFSLLQEGKIYNVLSLQFNATNRVRYICGDTTGLNRNITYWQFSNRGHKEINKERLITMFEGKEPMCNGVFAIWDFEVPSNYEITEIESTLPEQNKDALNEGEVMGFTKGNWKLLAGLDKPITDPYKIVSVDGIEIAITHWGIKSTYPETLAEVKANAALIVKAPKMFKALKWLGNIMLTANDGGQAWCAIRDQNGAHEFFQLLKEVNQ